MSINLIFRRFKSYRDYYNVLGVNQSSSSKEIKESFHKLSKIYHPDNKTTGDNAKFLQISQAYEAIKEKPVCDNVAGSEYEDQASIYNNYKQKVQPIYRRQEPLSMQHIQQVYRRLNEQDQDLNTIGDGTPRVRCGFTKRDPLPKTTERKCKETVRI